MGLPPSQLALAFSVADVLVMLEAGAAEPLHPEMSSTASNTASGAPILDTERRPASEKAAVETTDGRPRLARDRAAEEHGEESRTQAPGASSAKTDDLGGRGIAQRVRCRNPCRILVMP